MNWVQAESDGLGGGAVIQNNSHQLWNREGTCRKIRFLASNVQNLIHNQPKSGDLKNKIIVNYMYFFQQGTKIIHIFNM